ncbi:hypothetical protein OFO99_32090, partial [Escherichia coli]|nr:hypothetical protein [Escherichia coli]
TISFLQKKLIAITKTIINVTADNKTSFILRNINVLEFIGILHNNVDIIKLIIANNIGVMQTFSWSHIVT